MKIQVLVRLKPGVLDVQGKAVERSLVGLGFESVSAVRVGKLVELELPTASFDTAKEEVMRMCQELLINPILESYEIRQGCEH